MYGSTPTTQLARRELSSPLPRLTHRNTSFDNSPQSAHAHSDAKEPRKANKQTSHITPPKLESQPTVANSSRENPTVRATTSVGNTARACVHIHTPKSVHTTAAHTRTYRHANVEASAHANTHIRDRRGAHIRGAPHLGPPPFPVSAAAEARVQKALCNNRAARDGCGLELGPRDGRGGGGGDARSTLVRDQGHYSPDARPDHAAVRSPHRRRVRAKAGLATLHTEQPGREKEREAEKMDGTRGEMRSWLDVYPQLLQIPPQPPHPGVVLEEEEPPSFLFVFFFFFGAHEDMSARCPAPGPPLVRALKGPALSLRINEWRVDDCGPFWPSGAYSLCALGVALRRD